MTNRAYEPLTAENAALVLVDHQVGLMTGVRDISIGELKQPAWDQDAQPRWLRSGARVDPAKLFRKK